MNALLLAAALFAVDGPADTPQFLADPGNDLTERGELMVDREGAAEERVYAGSGRGDLVGKHPEGDARGRAYVRPAGWSRS